MPITIDLAPETEARLTEQALSQGIPTPELVRQILENAMQDILTIPDARATAFASEATLAKIWNTPEEDQAWENL